MDRILKRILKRINNSGYEAYIVGGYVRDKILKNKTNDIDICTNALPKDIIRIFKLDNKKQDNYGSINIKINKYNVDITTYRKESDYINHSNLKTEYVNDLKIDLKRRDFTCNTLLMDLNGKIIDFYDGKNDIRNRIIKCVGDVKEKLTNDPLRMLRAIRFSILYDFKIDENIIDFIKNNKKLIKTISYYRKKEELDKILSNKNSIKGLEFIKELGLDKVLELDYLSVNYTKDILGMYTQIGISDNYPFTKQDKNTIKKINTIVNGKEINNLTLYENGLYLNQIAGEILEIDNNTIKKMYKKLPIKSRKDIKISLNNIVKNNNNCYNNINEIYKKIETKILNRELNNTKKEIINYLNRGVNNE